MEGQTGRTYPRRVRKVSKRPRTREDAEAAANFSLFCDEELADASRLRLSGAVAWADPGEPRPWEGESGWASRRSHRQKALDIDMWDLGRQMEWDSNLRDCWERLNDARGRGVEDPRVYFEDDLLFSLLSPMLLEQLYVMDECIRGVNVYRGLAFNRLYH